MTDIKIPDFHLPNMPNIKPLLEMEFRKNNPADSIYDRILEQIKEFEFSLDNEHEIGGVLIGAAFTQFHITALKKSNPDMIVFYGDTENGPIQIIQHISQINIPLISLKKQQDHVEARRIGFITE